MKPLIQQFCTQKPDKLSNAEELKKLLEQTPNWTLGPEQQNITRRISCKNYYDTLARINAIAWIAHQQDHHPDIQFSYKHCTISYTTHSVGGLSVNDFICAARIDALD